MADNTTELEVLNEIVDVLGGTSGQHETVVPVLEDIRDLLSGGGSDGSGYNPALSVGRADALTGADSTAQWAQRESTGSGAATVRSVQGATEVQDNKLVPVQIAGIRSVGFNQWDEEWELGTINQSGEPTPSNTVFRSKNYIPVFPSALYFCKCATDTVIFVHYYDADGNWISVQSRSNQTFTTPSNARFIKFRTSSGATYNNDICINISNPVLNGQYKPYMTDSVEWTAQTLRAAGSAADMLYSDHVDVKVGATTIAIGEGVTFSASSEPNSAGLYNHTLQYTDSAWAASGLDTATYDTSHWLLNAVSVLGISDATGASGATNAGFQALDQSKRVYFRWPSLLTQAQFETLVSDDGGAIFFALATPTTQPISPALPMTYKVQQGGSESIIVPDGEVSAAPVLTVAEGESAATLVMDALACIATPDGPVATANHAINTYLTMQGKLYKVTSAIAVGESITPNTNVTETTVMAELVARTA